MSALFIFFCVLSVLGSAIAENEASSTAPPATPQPQPQPPQPVYKPQDQAAGYIPHQTYPYADSYGGSLYEGFYYPLAAKPPAPQPLVPPNYMSTVIPAAQGALQFTLKALAKFGLFLIGGAALLLIGGIFTTAVCWFTNICVITFPAFGGLNKETMRSFMTPDKMSAAAALVQDAIGKYQRLQRAIPN